MADSPILPGDRAWRDGSGRPMPVEFYRFFRDLLRFVSQSDSNAALIADILSRLEALEDSDQQDDIIRGLYSVVVSGTLANGVVDLQLQGDSSAPGPYSFYATDPSGIKGWRRPEPNETLNPYADYLVDENGNYLTDENGDFLTADDGFPINPDYLPDHNQFNGLQGGSTDERYHITSAQHTELSAMLAAAPVDVTGSRGGNAALASLLTALATIGLITDSTTA